MTAAPDVRSIMDNQFKNVKTHARLLSKAMWYEWRMKLLEGLKQGLLGISEGFGEDADALTKQEQLLASVVPQLVEEHDRLVAEATVLQAHADELASCDQEELIETRQQLVSVEEEVEAKKAMVVELEAQLQEKEQSIEYITDHREECLAEIKEADRVREECRGWSAAEVATLKGTSYSHPKPPHSSTKLTLFLLTS